MRRSDSMPEVEPSTDYLFELSAGRVAEDLARALAILRGYAIKTVLLRSDSFFIDFRCDELLLRISYGMVTGTTRLLKAESPPGKLQEMFSWSSGLPTRSVLDFQIAGLGGTPPEPRPDHGVVRNTDQPVPFAGLNARDRWTR